MSEARSVSGMPAAVEGLAGDRQPGQHRLTVAVLGAGVVGRTLATGWAAAGHRIALGSRDPDTDRMQDAVRQIRTASNGEVSALPHAEAAGTADVVVVCVPGDQAGSLVGDLAGQLAGRVVIDATNNTNPSAATLNAVELFTAAGSTVCRAFNTVGWEQLRQPWFGDIRSDMPYTGPASAAALVELLITDLGFRPIHLGDGPAALDAIDALARLWFLLVFGRGRGRRLGLRFLTAADDGPQTHKTVGA